MARKSKMSILKRQREVKKAEKQAMKREKRAERVDESGGTLATKEDLAGYGFVDEEEEASKG